jgi:hypothetical protein
MEKTQPAQTFSAIRREAERAIRAAEALIVEEFAGEPINWSALHVNQVEYWIDDQGDSGYRVYLDEASPNCPKLAAFVSGYISQAGFECEVRTEW